MASPYATPAAARSIIGEDNLAIVCNDADAADNIDATRLQSVIDEINSKIDGRIKKRYTTPIAADDIPPYMQRIACYLVHEALCRDPGNLTEMITARADRARKDLKDIADGKQDLQISDAEDADNAARADTQVVSVTAADRVFKRTDKAGVL